MVQELADGRFILGIGVGHQVLVESWHGTEFSRPLAAMRDYLTILKQATESGGVDHQGEIFHASFAFLGYQPPKVPIYVAALGPKMCQLAGELADGVILWLSSPKHIREVVIPNLEIGAGRAGRSLDDFEIFGCLFAAPGVNRPAGRDAIRQQLLTYLQLPFYQAAARSAGYDDELDGFDIHLKKGDIPAALSSLSDRMIDDLGATGSPEDVAETLHGFVTAGCTMPGVGIAGRYDGFEGIETAFRSLIQAGTLVP